jgi:hypothetical protein
VRPLASSPAWTLVTPYCKRTRPARDEHEGRGISTTLTLVFGHLTSPPFRARPRADPSGLGHATTFTRRPRDPPVSKRRQYSKFNLEYV